MVIKDSSKNKTKTESKRIVLHSVEERQLAELHSTEASCWAPQGNASQLHWWHHGCSDRLPHSRLSAKTDSPYTVRDVSLGFLLTGC